MRTIICCIFKLVGKIFKILSDLWYSIKVIFFEKEKKKYSEFVKYRKNRNGNRDDIPKEIKKGLTNGVSTGLDARLELSKYSLESIIHATEYQDEKAQRSLTAVVIITAISGVIFRSVISDELLNRIEELSTVWQYVIYSIYATFFLEIFCIAIGAFITLSATRASFLIPEAWPGEPKSRLFWLTLTNSSPYKWSRLFSSSTSITELKRQYLSDCVLETYLIAEKIGDKVEKLILAQCWLLRGLRLFLIWFFLYGSYLFFSPTTQNMINNAYICKPIH